ncbi:Uncharacterised protein [Bordetella pertussis]|nr:Uncharacterised protein [Bordetella pertussis]
MTTPAAPPRAWATRHAVRVWMSSASAQPSEASTYRMSPPIMGSLRP